MPDRSRRASCRRFYFIEGHRIAAPWPSDAVRTTEIRIAASRDMSRQSESNVNQLRFQCRQCGVSLRVSVKKFAGRYIECPKCKSRTPVPASQEEADAENKNVDVNVMAYDVPATCMKCGKKMKKGAVLCVKCGFDYRQGRQLVVNDDTAKKGEKTRGGPALGHMLFECVLGIGTLVALIVRFNGPQRPEWYELGLYISGILIAVAFIPMHVSQWLSYHRIPIRDHALKLEEDRAERKEAREPYGRWTGLLVLLALAAGIGSSYATWGMGQAKTAAAIPNAQEADARAEEAERAAEKTRKERERKNRTKNRLKAAAEKAAGNAPAKSN